MLVTSLLKSGFTAFYFSAIGLWDTDFWICIKVLRPQRIYEGMNITKVTGVTASQVDALKSLGALAE